MIYTDGDWYEGDWVDDLSQITIKFQNTETENMCIVKEPFIKENGRMMFRMVMDMNSLLMVLSIQGSLKMERRMDLATINGQMVRVMRGIFNPIILVDMGINAVL